MKLVLVDYPKEITCKGALKANLNQGIDGCKTQFWIGYNERNNGIFDKSEKTNTPKYSEMLMDKQKAAIASSIMEFYSVLDKYISKVSLQNEFGIEDMAYVLFKDMRNNHLVEYLETGLKAANRVDDNYVEDTMFFYPLSAVLNALANVLSDSYTTN